MKPGASTSVSVQVNDADGAPVDNADVLLVVVDEAVLALSGYQLVDPLEVFYRSLGVYLETRRRARDSILLQNPQELLDSIGGDGAVTTTVAATTVADEAGDDMADDAEMAEESASADF